MCLYVRILYAAISAALSFKVLIDESSGFSELKDWARWTSDFSFFLLLSFFFNFFLLSVDCVGGGGGDVVGVSSVEAIKELKINCEIFAFDWSHASRRGV